MAKIKMMRSTANHKLAKEATNMIRRGRKPLTDAEKAKDMRFIRVAGIRLAKILKLMKGLRACANTAVYEYTESQVEKMLSMLRKSLERTEALYSAPKGTVKVYKANKLENPLA